MWRRSWRTGGWSGCCRTGKADRRRSTPCSPRPGTWPPRCGCSWTPWASGWRACEGNQRRTLSGLHEAIGEAIGLALDRGIEHLDRVRIVLVREDGAFRLQYEACRLHLLANRCRLNPRQRLGVARARPDGGGVVHDDVGPAGLQPLVDGSIEVGRCRAPGLDQRG